MTTVRFADFGHNVTVAFAYNPAVVQLLKDTVPGYARTWEASRKHWEIDRSWAETLAAALRSAGHTVVGMEQPKQNKHPDATQWALMLFNRVGPARSTAVYRALSKCLHPDTPTGDTTLQRELNDAHTATQDAT